MNWVFWALILIVVIVIWFLISGLFNPIGRFFSKIFEDTVNILNEEEEDKLNEQK